MRKFEKQLKLILAISQNGSDPIHQSQLSCSEGDLRYLSARKLLELSPAGDDQYYIFPTEDGIIYFDKKREDRVAFWKDLFSRFSVGVATGVVSTLLVEHFLIPVLSKL